MDDATRRRFLQTAGALEQWVDAVGGATGLLLVTPREAAARVVAMEAAYTSA